MNSNNQHYVLLCPTETMNSNNQHYVLLCPTETMNSNNQHYVLLCPTETMNSNNQHYVLLCPNQHKTFDGFLSENSDVSRVSKNNSNSDLIFLDFRSI